MSSSSYPTTPAQNKHDVLCLDPPPSLLSRIPSLEDYKALVSSMRFSSVDQLFHAVDDPPPPTTTKSLLIASVYSYEDSPEHPGPLSRGLTVLGTADRSLSLVRRLVDRGAAAPPPDGLHQCTVAVQLADAKHYGRLEPRHQRNSTQFARFMVALRRQNSVAILGKDKYGRFGVLAPMAKNVDDDSADGDGQYTVDDFVTQCYIGDVEEVKRFLADSATTSATTEQSNERGVVVSNPWETNEDDEGPTFRPAEDDDDVAGEDHGGWQPTTPPVPPDDGGDGANGFSAPWDASAGGNDDAADDNGGGGGTSMPWETSEEPAANGDGGGASMPWETGEDPVTQTNGDSGGGSMPWETQNEGDDDTTNRLPWETDDNEYNAANKRSFDEMNSGYRNDDEEEAFHKNKAAAEADTFYSGLTRSLDTRADSYLFHMRSFNGWVKATQIAELDPRIVVNGKVQPKQPLRVLDLACGKGGDLIKWTLHPRGMKHYVGIDVARGSLKDAAERARGMRQKKKLENAIFSCADLGSDVPGRKKTSKSKNLQKLLTWRLEDEALYESGPPEFTLSRGGGISESDKFDVVSIQFAIHYMMQSGERARRFFHTVSQLLEMGGLLALTTIDARVVIDHMMNLGLNYHFESDKEPEFSEVVVEAGSGACKLKFERNIVKKILQAQSDGTKGEEELFGLEYTFTLVEGSDHAAGVGDAVNLPEWLIPIPVLVALGRDAGLELDYVQNFHEFYNNRKDPNEHAAAHTALYNMKVVNRNGTISKDEWSLSRLYAAMRFRKVRESSIVIESDNETLDDKEDDDDDEPEIQLDPEKLKKLYPMAMMKAKKAAGEQWNSLSREEKEERTQMQLRTMAAQL